MSDSAKKYTIAVIPGDGIGKEVTPWAQKALEKAAEGVAEFEYEKFDLGAERYLRDGAILPEDEEERIKKTDAILLGAVGDPRIKAGILERGLLLKLRFDLDQYVNLRPSKLYKGVTSPLANPGDIDFVVVREGTEGLYCGAGGAVRRGTPNEVATEVSINTAYGVERVVRYAFQLAMKRRKHVTLVHKKNVLVNAGDMWQRIVNKVAEEYPEVTHDYLHIDATTIFMVSNPSRFDVILTDNLFGDIITDEAAQLQGGVGTAGSANMVAKSGDRTKAAICSKRSADIYGLEILAEAINSNANNTTRFVVISTRLELRPDRDKVSTCFCVPHQSGSLHEILTIFAVHGLNMVRLESRPIQGRSWEYMFFLEFSGDITAPGMEGVFRELTQSADHFRVLGNFVSNLH